LLSRILNFGAEEGRALAYLSSAAVALLLSFSAVRAFRHLALPESQVVPGAIPTVAAATLIIGTVLLNAKGFARAGNRVQAASISRCRLFSFAFAGIVIVGLFCRVAWTRSVYFPGTTPDSYTYLLPALENPTLPLDETRPIAFPYLISLSLTVFRHPIGILIVSNLLAIAAAVVLALGLRSCLDSRIASLLLVTYVLFAAKNVAFEYILMAEHLSRSVAALVLGTLFWLRKPVSALLAAVLAALTVVGILAKPTAVILIPAVLVGFLVRRLTCPRWSWREVSKASAVYTAVVATFVGGYMTLFFFRFGSFQVTSMTGFSLYWHVNQLTDLEGPAHPEVKRELRKFFPLYLGKYVSRGENLGNWAVWGSRTPELERDFGLQSPERVVRDYVQRHGSGSVFHRMNRVFMDLALEGIRAHPVKYLEISLRSTLGLLYHGLTFSYGIMPIIDVGGAAARAQFFREWYFNAHLRWEDMVLTPGFRPANRQSILILAPDALGRFIAIWFKTLSAAAIALFGFTAWWLRPGTVHSSRATSAGAFRRNRRALSAALRFCCSWRTAAVSGTDTGHHRGGYPGPVRVRMAVHQGIVAVLG
jgi:hypothetical protein